jgi:tetratricopeptide (TPR) repeat protein
MVALSFALNHAISGFSPWSYRALNLALHIGSALLLAYVIRRTLAARPGLTTNRAGRIAAWSALLFAAHPLATTVVTYTVQRAEGLMAFLYLATLAAAARYLGDPGKRRWAFATVLLCALGMATKGTMVTAPLAVLLLHRVGFALSWGEVGKRWRWYLGLSATWAVLAACMITWPRRQSVGFGFEDMGALDYLNLQAGAWWHYLSLIVAPWRIAIDHWPVPSPVGTALALGLGFAVLYIASVVWAWRRSAVAGAGLLLAGLILLPTSTLVPIVTSPVADHRMYLPAAFGLSVAVAGIFATSARRPWLAPLTLSVCAVALAFATVRSNAVYRSERAVWENAVARDGNNARALNNLGMALANEGRADEGESRIKQALALHSGYADAWYNLGTLQGRDGHLASAEESLSAALALRPGYASAHCNLAVVLNRRGKKADAIRHYEQALRLRPDYPAANFNLAVVYLDAGDYARALPLALACLRADPEYPKAKELVADLRQVVQTP